MLKIRKDRILMIYACGGRKEEERKKKKEDEQIKIFKFGFYKLIKGQWNF